MNGTTVEFAHFLAQPVSSQDELTSFTSPTQAISDIVRGKHAAPMLQLLVCLILVFETFVQTVSVLHVCAACCGQAHGVASSACVL
jgi:hypothetical protein